MRRWGQLLTIMLLVCALALRAWVPAGWMPAAGAHDFSIMPCPAAIGQMAAMGDGSGHRDHHNKNGDCFSPLLAAAALPTPVPPVAAPSLPAEAAHESIARAILTRAPPAPTPPSTGPPPLA